MTSLFAGGSFFTYRGCEVGVNVSLVACRNVLCLSMAVGILAGCDSGPTPPPADRRAVGAPAAHRPTDPQVRPVDRSQSDPTTQVSDLPARPSLDPPKTLTFPSFQEVSSDLGIEFTYTNGASKRVLMVEATGGGAGWIDFDGDGLLDLYLCQGGDPATKDHTIEPMDQIFRQIEPGRFVRVTEQTAIVEQNYSQGVAVADYDDDGFDDVYVTNVGPDTLLHNQGDGTFVDVSQTAGVLDRLWSTSAAWGDLDGDGDLDLYVCNYVDYDPYHPLICGSEGKPGTCHPMHVDPVPDECYFNQGDGTFSPEAQSRGLFGPGNKALGVVIADLNNDGLRDVYIANDTTPNFLFINQGHGQFVESANTLGCAVSRDGLPQASMGVALGDYDHSGWLDLYCTHFTKESNTLYKNLGKTGFQDVTGLVGLHTPTLRKLGFGTVMTDFNQDGHEDIFVTNGHVDDWREKGDDHEMQAQLFSFAGPRFVECTSSAGDFFSRKLIGRGVAQGDFDNDGDWDLAVVHQNSPVAILRNDSDRGHWLKLRFVARGNRRGWGVRAVVRQGQQTLTQELAGGVSYCAAHDPSLIFGLGVHSEPADVEIRWPDGSEQVVHGVSLNRQVTIRQGAAEGIER